MKRHANVSIFVPHIGCPQQCSFCNQHAITGGARPPLPEDVRAAAETAARQLGGGAQNAEIAFFGGSFTAVPREYMLSLLKIAEKSVKEFGFAGIRCSTRPDAVDRETLALLREHGVTAVELGAQSMDDGVLAANRRGHTAAQTEAAAQAVRESGFELGLQMMTGLWKDTEEKALRTAERLLACRPDTVRVYPAVVLRGTELAGRYERGEYRPQTLEEAVSLCAKLLMRFEEAGVRVLRMGLHAERDVEEQKLAGPYHPAFGELVQSRVFLERLLPALDARGPGAYRVGVHPRGLSVALGQKRSNLAMLLESGYEVSFQPDEEVPRGQFAIEQTRGPSN